MKKMIITGGKTSFIGRNLCDFYKDKYEIHTMDKWTKPQQYLENHVKPDIIIHAGAEIYNDDAMFQYNIERSKEILDYCRYNLIEKVIIFGSSSEYGRVSWPISEDHGLNPNTMYEATKGAVSLLAQGYSKTYDIPITLIRPFTIVGRYEKPHKFFPTLYRAARKNLPIKLAPGVHDFVFIDDFLAAFDVLLNRKEEALFNVINIGSGRQTSNHEIVSVFANTMNYLYNIEHIGKLRSFDSDHWVCNNEKLFSKYGFRNFSSIHEGVQKFVADCDRLGLYNE